jgi:hypothetical protein
MLTGPQQLDRAEMLMAAECLFHPWKDSSIGKVASIIARGSTRISTEAPPERIREPVLIDDVELV